MLVEHMTFTPKYRGKVLIGNVAIECQKLIYEVCENINVDILDLAIMSDHVHLLIQHPPKISMSEIAEKIKSITSKELRQKFPHLKKWCKKAFWSRGYYATSVGHGHNAVQHYIQNQVTNHATSKCMGNVGRLPNMVGELDDTLPEEV